MPDQEAFHPELLINRQGQQLFEKENTEDMEKVSEDIRL